MNDLRTRESVIQLTTAKASAPERRRRAGIGLGCGVLAAGVFAALLPFRVDAGTLACPIMTSVTLTDAESILPGTTCDLLPGVSISVASPGGSLDDQGTLNALLGSDLLNSASLAIESG